MRRLLLALLVCPVLFACGGGDGEGSSGGGGGEVRIDADEFAERVQMRVGEATGAQTDVSCRNDGEPAVARMIVTCQVRDDKGATTVADVTITAVDDDAGAAEPIRADIDVPIVPTARIEADAPQQLRGQIGAIEVDCPTLVPVADPLDFECPITSPASAEGVVVRVSGPVDDLRYRTVRG